MVRTVTFRIPSNVWRIGVLNQATIIRYSVPSGWADRLELVEPRSAEADRDLVPGAGRANSNDVTLRVDDMLGREVSVPVNEWKAPGREREGVMEEVAGTLGSLLSQCHRLSRWNRTSFALLSASDGAVLKARVNGFR